ncbi:MAG: DUF72 domain-containing protein [Chloroflexota bacterium]
MLADRRHRATLHWRTSDWGFVRLHEGLARPRPGYREAVLRQWVRRIAEIWPSDADVFAFFNNDHRACAPRDAGVFARLAAESGLQPTRTPDPGEVKLASGRG